VRPAILVPRPAQDWPESQRHAVLTHELAHVKRGDLWTNMAAALATFIFWFHPLAWMLARRLREEQECACDDIVLNRGFKPTVYAEALVGAASARPSGSLFACAMNGGAFRKRVAHVLDSACCRTTRRTVIARMAVAAFAAVVVLGMLQPAVRAAEDVYKIGGDVQAPQLITKIEPKYTDEARDAKIQGTVKLKVVIGSSGHVTESTVLASLDAGLDRNAQGAVAQWVFRPGTKKGEPVAVQATIEINFRLQ
jgi:TonB family protein